MLFQLPLVRQNPVQTAIQSGVVDPAFFDLQQIIQRRRGVPALLHRQLAARAHNRLMASTAATRDQGTISLTASSLTFFRSTRHQAILRSNRSPTQHRALWHQTNDDHNLPSLALQLSARLAPQSKFLIAIHLDIVEVQNSAEVPGLRFR